MCKSMSVIAVMLILPVNFPVDKMSRFLTIQHYINISNVFQQENNQHLHNCIKKSNIIKKLKDAEFVGI